MNINNDNADYNSDNNICYYKIERLVSPTQATNQKNNEEYIQSINSINCNDS